MNNQDNIQSFTRELLSLCQKHKVNLSNTEVSFDNDSTTYIMDLCGQWKCTQSPPVSIYTQKTDLFMEIEDNTLEITPENIDSLPLVKVISVTDNPDGTATIQFETSNKFDKMAAKELNIDLADLTPEMVGSYLEDMLTKASENIDGYSFSTSKISTKN